MCNLLSVGQLLEKEYRVFFKNKVCTIYDKYPRKQLIARVEMTKNRMFPLIMRNDLTNSLNAYKTKSLNQSWLWHLRYGVQINQWWFRFATEEVDGKMFAKY